MQDGSGPKIIVIVNDTGPFDFNKKTGNALYPLRPHPTRKIDLTPVAFKELTGKSTGVVKVKITISCKKKKKK
jgi:rare lipoprotein A (peptidoglycan hydrolase)